MQLATLRVVRMPATEDHPCIHVYQVLRGDEKVVGGSCNTDDTSAAWALAFKRAREKGFTHYVEHDRNDAVQAIPAAVSI